MQTALVTGGARRMGRVIVEALAREGYAVAIHFDRSRDEANDLRTLVRCNGGEAEVVQADLGDPDDLLSLVERARAKLGPLTLLVNNASVFEADELHTTDRALWERHFAINLQAPVFLARDFARQLPDGSEGSVVNIIDQRVWKPNPLFFSYTLSKAALFAATRTMAQALAPRVRVNAVGPGPTLPSRRQTETDFSRQSANVPLGHGPGADEIATTVLFLAKAKSVTGQMLAVDGGQHLAWETPDVLAAGE